MPRFALVACLIFCLLLTGCAGVRSGLDNWEQPFRSLDDRPVLKGCAYGAFVVGIGVLIVAAVWLNDREDRDPYHRTRGDTN